MAVKIYTIKCKKCPKIIESLYEKQAEALMLSHQQTHLGDKDVDNVGTTIM